MSTMQEDLAWLIAREKIRECIARLARGEDRRDAALIRASCWPESRTDYGVFAGDFEAYLAWVVPGAPTIPVTQHVLGQSFIELDGETARVETQLVSYHRLDMGGEHRDTCIGGRYLDRMELRGSEWRIAERIMLYDWFEDFGVAIDWSKGLMGLRLTNNSFIGKAASDHSVAFFGKG